MPFQYTHKRSTTLTIRVSPVLHETLQAIQEKCHKNHASGVTITDIITYCIEQCTLTGGVYTEGSTEDIYDGLADYLSEIHK